MWIHVAADATAVAPCARLINRLHILMDGVFAPPEHAWQRSSTAKQGFLCDPPELRIKPISLAAAGRDTL